MGNEVTVRPDRWMTRGEAQVDDPRKPLVVWSGIPGERARVRVSHSGQNRAYGYVVEAEPPDPHRVAPPCERYALCGGCPLMHLDAAGQEQARRSLVRQALEEEGLGDVELGAFHPSPDGLTDFRHMIKLGFGYSDRGHIRVGAWGRRDRRIVTIPECPVALPVLRRTMISVAHFTIERRIRPWVEGRGILRAAVLRASRTTGEVLVTLVAGRRIRELAELAEDLAGHVPNVVGVWLHLNDEPGNAIFSPDEEGAVRVLPLVGKETIEEQVGGVSYDIGPGDFFQTNPAMAEVLYARTLDRLDLGQEVPVVDLYSGVGGLALQAARRTRWALGVEEVAGAVQRARGAARRQSLPAEFVAGRVEDVLPDVGRRLRGKAPVLTVNPARRGLEPGVVQAMLALEPRRIAYVSCNPRALARDLRLFREGGLKIGAVELFDMFPNTAHVEALVTLDAPGVARGGGRAPRRKVVR